MQEKNPIRQQRMIGVGQRCLASKNPYKNAGVREASTSSTAVPVDGSTGRSLGKVLHYGPLVPFLSAWGKLPSL